MYANDLMQVLALLVGLSAMLFVVAAVVGSLVARRWIVNKSSVCVALGVWILCSVLFDLLG
jgi:hypothetical protein